MRAVARTRAVVEDGHEAGMASSDTAGRLDVLGRRLRLSHDDHQPETVDVDADGDHVGCKDHVDRIRQGLLHESEVPWDVARLDAAGHLNHLLAGDASESLTGEQVRSIDD